MAATHQAVDDRYTIRDIK